MTLPDGTNGPRISDRAHTSELVEAMRAAAAELSCLGQKQGVDLSQFCGSRFLFLNETAGRMIFVWRVDSGIAYNMQGRILALPQVFTGSASAFNGMWSESGVLPDLDRTLEFVVAWLVDAREVDELPIPQHHRKRWGIG